MNSTSAVPRSISLVDAGLITPSIILTWAVPFSLKMVPAASAGSMTTSPSTSRVKSAAAASSSVVVNVVAPCVATAIVIKSPVSELSVICNVLALRFR